ncbi:hypothetical protein ACFL20_06535 [Spirochaetota bacterium]
MSENVYYEYEVPDEIPELTREEKEIERKLICENIDLIINNLGVIINNEKYFYTKISMGFLGTTITGTKVLHMGILALLWKDRKLTDKCEVCGSKVYILGAGGSLLSGSHQWHGCCSKCKEITHGRKKSFSQLYHPVFEITKRYPNKTVIRKYKAKSKEWYNKITEKIPPDEVIKKKKEGISFEELIGELKSR